VHPGVGFLIFLGVTLAFLGGVVVTGIKAKRRTHLALVSCAVVCLGVTIYYAEKLGELYDLRASGLIFPIHLWIAKITVAAYLAPIVTGILTWRNVARRPLHAKLAYTVLALTILTAITGTLMIALSERLPHS